MSIFDKLKSMVGLAPQPEPEPIIDTAVTGSVAQPIEVNLSLRDHEAIPQALYRIDAIRRYIMQKDEDGREVNPQRMEEFRIEIRQRTAYLLSKGVINSVAADEIVKSIEPQDEGAV